MFKRKRAYVISEHPIRYFFDELGKVTEGLWALGKRLALVGLVVWGGSKYLKKGGEETVKEGFSARLSELKNTELMRNFREGLGMIKEVTRTPTPEEKAANEKWLERVHKEREDLKKSLGVKCLGLEHVDRKDPRWAEAVRDNRELREHFRER